MRDHIGKYKLERDGTVSSKDFQVQSDINSARFFINSELKMTGQWYDKLSGR